MIFYFIYRLYYCLFSNFVSYRIELDNFKIFILKSTNHLIFKSLLLYIILLYLWLHVHFFSNKQHFLLILIFQLKYRQVFFHIKHVGILYYILCLASNTPFKYKCIYINSYFKKYKTNFFLTIQFITILTKCCTCMTIFFFQRD